MITVFTNVIRPSFSKLRKTKQVKIGIAAGWIVGMAKGIIGDTYFV